MATIECNCTSSFQDKIYGLNRRVFTESTKGYPLVYRCTVCGKTQPAPVQPKQKF